MWQHQGKRREAHRMLSEIYNWFTKGFHTRDLQAAKALLEALHWTTNGLAHRRVSALHPRHSHPSGCDSVDTNYSQVFACELATTNDSHTVLPQ